MPSVKVNPSRINQARLAGISTEMPPAPQHGPWPTETLLFTQMPVAEAVHWQRQAAEQMHEGQAPGHRLVLTEHPPTVTGRPAPEGWQEAGATGAAGAPEWFAPGMLLAWLTLHLDHWEGDLDELRHRAGMLVLRILKDFDIDGAWGGDGASILAGTQRVARVRVVAEGRIALAHLAINTNTDPDARAAIGVTDETSMTELGIPVHRQNDVRAALIDHYPTIFDSRLVIPQRTGVRTSKPPWLRVKLPVSAHTQPVYNVMRQRKLHTVCESARCPNQGECWGHGTATFMINGNVCTRSCSFCAVFTGRPQPLDPDEPRRVAEAAAVMGLRYAVVTAVNRDELPDGGAAQFVRTIEALREAVPGMRVEVLIPDFHGVESALDAVFAARPDVLNHNVETVARLYDRVRPQARYERTLEVLRRSKAAGLVTKSGFMLGLGEEDHEVAELMRDLRDAGCDIVTIGQYLRPSEYHHPVVRYVTPSEFAEWRRYGMEELGIRTVQSGPLVRSSYHAHESFDATDPAD